MKRLSTFLVLALLGLAFSLQASSNFDGKKVSYESHMLDDIFYEYEVYDFDYAELSRLLKENPEGVDVKFDLGLFTTSVHLYAYDIRSENYEHRVMTENGLVILPKSENITYRGFTTDGKDIRLTVNDEMITGYFETGKELIFIESIFYLDTDAPKSYSVIYSSKEVKPTPDKKCALHEKLEKEQELEERYEHEVQNHEGHEKMAGLCWLFELAIASDWQMVQHYGSVGAVEDRNVSTLNDVQPLWNMGQFEDDIEYLIVTQWTSSCSTCDPWTNSTNAGTLLGSFRNWGESGGFGVNYDIACLWTHRNLNGGTIGVAYLSGTCNSAKYHVCEDYGGGAVQIRNLWAHEMGHNFSCQHTNGFWIMAPSVNTSDDWAPLSVTQVDNFVDGLENGPCPDACGPPPEAPEAYFESDVRDGCIPFFVEYYDLSTGTISDWDWEFPGGDPDASTDQNPVVLYETRGFWDASLTVTGPLGSDTWEEFEYIEAKDVPVASFTYTANGREFEFDNTSDPSGDIFFWDFGDGNTSFEENPIHLYDQDGVYDVTFMIENDCGSDEITQTIDVISPVTADFTSDIQKGCAILDVQFEDLSSDNVEIWEWTFEGGEPDFSTDQHPLVSYDAPGTYRVELEVFSRLGRYQDKMVKVAYITVDSLPDPSFTDSTDVNNGLRVIFDNTSVNATSYEWDFGDGNGSTDVDPIHTYASDGIYTVLLRATNQCGDEWFEKDIEVSSAPIAQISSTPDVGCVGQTVQYFDQSLGTVNSVLWEFEGGSPATSTDRNPVVTYNTAGVYDVNFYATNTVGTDTLLNPDYMEIKELPTAAFDSDWISDGTYDFTNNSDFYNGSIWDFGDGDSSTVNDPTHTYTADGTYTVILTSFNECDTVRSTEVLNVVLLPVAGIASDPNDGCVDLVVQFNDASTGTVDMHEWTFEGGDPATSNDPNPIVTYNARGVYDVRLIVTNVTGSDTVDMMNHIEVEDIPTAGYDYTQDSLDFAFNDTSIYSVDSVKWDFGDGNGSTMFDPMHSYDEAGVYPVTLIAYNHCGTDTLTQDVFIGGAEPLAIIASSENVICVGDTVFFMDDSQGNPDTWTWLFEAGDPDSSNLQNPYVIYNTPGVFDVFLRASNQFGMSTSTLVDYITVIAPPQLDPTYDADDLSVDFNSNLTPGSVDSIRWDFGNGDFSTEMDPTYEYDEDGMYTVTVTVYTICGEYSYMFDVDVMTSSNLEIIVDNLSIYPNPTRNMLYLESSELVLSPSLKVSIVDILGRNTGDFDHQMISSEKLSLDVSRLVAGTYFVEVQAENGRAFGKFVISE